MALLQNLSPILMDNVCLNQAVIRNNLINLGSSKKAFFMLKIVS
jgi:hypothetical protein